MDYSLIENQFGCGWCKHELTCEMRTKWKIEREKENRVWFSSGETRDLALLCGKFNHYSKQVK